jgi:hypothetical protein
VSLLRVAITAFAGSFFGASLALYLLNRDHRDLWLHIRELEKCVETLLRGRLRDLEERRDAGYE